MKVKLQFFTAIASLALLGNAMAQSIAVSNPGVIKGDTAVVTVTYTAGGGTTNLDFSLAYDETVIDENSPSFAADCSGAPATGLLVLNCSIDKTSNEIKGIGINFSGLALTGGALASITLPTLPTAAIGDSTNPANYNFSAGGVVTPVQSDWTLTVTDGPQPGWTSIPSSFDPSPQFNFGTLNADDAPPAMLPLTISNTGQPESLLNGTCYMGLPQQQTGAPQVASGFSIVPPADVIDLPTGGATEVIMIQFDPTVAAIGQNTDMVTCEHNGSQSIPVGDGPSSLGHEPSPVTYNLAAHVMGYQTITGFAATPPSPGLVNGSSTLSATGGGSGNDVLFASATPTVCTVATNVVTYLIGGTCTVTADQAGNADYHAAQQVTLNITVNKLDQAITNFASAPAGVVDGTATLSSTPGDSGEPVVYASTTLAACTVSGSTVTFLTAGTGVCNVTANQAGNDMYNDAPEVPLALDVAKADQTITNLAASVDPGKVGTSASLSSTVSSSLTPTYNSSTPGICTVSGTTVTYLATGTCTITADQAGDANYNPAPQASIGVTVNPGDQFITNFFADPDGGGIDDISTLFATGGASGNPVVFDSLTTDVCTVSGNIVTYVNVGVCTVSANQAGNVNYNAAPQVTLDLIVAEATSIPTLSQWGLISMFLIMLTLGGMVIRRRDMLN